MNIGDAVLQMIQIADVAIVVIRRPKRAGAPQQSIDLNGRGAFPALDNGRERDFVKQVNQHMEMIGHDDPSDEFVGVTMVPEELVLYEHGAFRSGENRLPVSLILMVGDAAVEFVLAAGFVRRTGQLMFPCRDDVLRHRIRQPEGDGLHGFRKIPMRKVTPAMDAPIHR